MNAISADRDVAAPVHVVRVDQCETARGVLTVFAHDLQMFCGGAGFKEAMAHGRGVHGLVVVLFILLERGIDGKLRPWLS